MLRALLTAFALVLCAPACSSSSAGDACGDAGAAGGACSAPAGSTTHCFDAGASGLAQPLLVLERGDETAALGRISGSCFTETSPDPVLGSDQFLLDAHGAPFVGVDTDGSLRAVDTATLRITKTYDAYPDYPVATSTAHGLYGVDLAGGNLWISRDDVNQIAVLDQATGALVGTVDLTTFDEPGEGKPDMNGILVVGSTAYVALGFLSHTDPNDAGVYGGISSDTARRPGMIAIIDVAMRKPVGHIDLVGHNPVKKLIPTDATQQTVIVATPGQHATIDAGDGIDIVDLAAGTAKQLVSETALGGSVDEVVWGGPTEAYAIVLGPGLENPTQLVAFNPQTGVVDPTPLARAPSFTDPSGAAYVFVGLALDGPWVVVGDQTPGAAAVRAFSRATHQEVASFPAAVLPPVGLVVPSL